MLGEWTKSKKLRTCTKEHAGKKEKCVLSSAKTKSSQSAISSESSTKTIPSSPSVLSSKSPQSAISSESSTSNPKKRPSNRKTVPSQPQFQAGQDVLVHSQKYNQLFDARVLKSRSQALPDGGTKWQYLVHYLKWASKWDNWADEELLSIPTSERRQEQVELKAAAKVAETARKSCKGRKANPKMDVKASAEDNVDDSLPEPPKAFLITIPPALEVSMPDHVLIAVLSSAHDVKFETVHVWRKYFANLLQRNVATTKTKAFKTGCRHVHRSFPSPLESSTLMPPSLQGLTTYFDEALRLFLLYRFERAQYKRLKMNEQRSSMSEVYGAEHLLRLFAKLPDLAVQAPLMMNDQSTLINFKAFQRRATKLLRFIDKNSSRFLVGSYEPADAAYLAEFLGT